jgi:RNA polymerase sigma-70 factor, ECF subfamily
MDTVARAGVRSLYRCHRGKVLARAFTLLRNQEAAEDATQEAFERLLQAEDLVLRHPEPLAWLYRVTTNLCLNVLRDEKRHAILMAQTTPANDPQGSDAETRTAVAEIFGRVPSELQEIAVRYHADGMTCKEIAVSLGVSRRTIGNRLMAFRDEAASVVTSAWRCRDLSLPTLGVPGVQAVHCRLKQRSTTAATCGQAPQEEPT